MRSCSFRCRFSAALSLDAADADADGGGGGGGDAETRATLTSDCRRAPTPLVPSPHISHETTL